MDVDLINVAYYFTKGHCIGFQKCDSQWVDKWRNKNKPTQMPSKSKWLVPNSKHNVVTKFPSIAEISAGTIIPTFSSNITI